MWEQDRPQKFSMLLLGLGFIIGITGAAAAFLLSPAFTALFYLGFLVVIFGFAFAVYAKLKEKK